MAAAAQALGATTKVAAVQTNVPWHCWAFLAFMRNRDDNARWQKVATDGRWLLGIVARSLPCCTMAMATMLAMQTTVCNNNGGGSADNCALALSAIPCLLLQWH
jgi:hypothetical protein